MNNYKPHELKSLYGSLDQGIARQVQILMSQGVETFESCEGGAEHSYPEPTVRFHGERSAGWKALGVALENDLDVYSLRRIWTVIDGEPIGAYWEMTFRNNKPLSCKE